MYQIQLTYMGQLKKVTVTKSLPPHQLNRLIAQCFHIPQQEQIIGFTNQAGKFHELDKLCESEVATRKEVFSLVTVKDLHQQTMSFASEFYQRQSKKNYEEEQGPLELPQHPATRCIGLISDLDLFQELVLSDERVAVVACFTKVRPPTELAFEYYLFQNQQKNSVVVYSGGSKVCEFYVGDWVDPSPEVGNFIQGLTGEEGSMKKKASYDQFNL